VEGGEGRKSAHDVFGSGHGPCELLGIPFDRLRWFNELAIAPFDGRNLRYVVFDEALLNG